MLQIVFLYYAIINIFLFLLMGIDKYKAIKNEWRISEELLFSFTFFGAFIGLFLGMRIFKHKTKKKKFYVVVIISAIVHSYIIYRILGNFNII